VTQAAAATHPRSKSALLRAINKARTSRGLTPFVEDTRLDAPARQHVSWMLHSGRFTHGDFGSRILRSHAPGPTFGENLAWGAGSEAAPGAIVQAWLSSPEHRLNLLRPGFHRIGLGVAKGAFAGYSGAVVVTADFAGR
jgi:uncharacterized protein YkwD